MPNPAADSKCARMSGSCAIPQSPAAMATGGTYPTARSGLRDPQRAFSLLDRPVSDDLTVLDQAVECQGHQSPVSGPARKSRRDFPDQFDREKPVSKEA